MSEEEEQVYEVPYLLLGLWRQLPPIPGVKRGGHLFRATRSDALKVVIALDALRRQGRENQRQAILQLQQARAERSTS